jgi:hypothetical protein
MKQTYLPGTEPDPIDETKERLAAAEKATKDGKKQMQDSALKLAELVADRLVVRGGDIGDAAAAYLNARDAYLAGTRDAGEQARILSDLIAARHEKQ